MHILIFEVNLDGHHSIYLERISESHLKLGNTVTVVFSAAFEKNIAINKLKNLYPNSLNVALLEKNDCENSMKSVWGNVGREISLWYLFRKKFTLINTRKKIDQIFFPYVDYCLNAIGILGSPFKEVAWSGICMRPTFHYKNSGIVAPSSLLTRLKSLIFNRVIKNKNLTCLFSIDKSLVNYINKRFPELIHRISYLPDPAEPPLVADRKILRNHYNVNINKNIILVYGAIDERKNLFPLLNALLLDKTLIKWNVLIVGQQSNSVRTRLNNMCWDNLKKENRLHIIDTFVTEEIEHHVFSMCDSVWIAYLHHYQMSGVLVKAGLYRKPVIACEDGLIGWYTREYQLGVILKKYEVNNINIAINNLKKSNNFKKFSENGFQLFKNNTWSNFLSELMKNRDIFY